MQVVQRHKKPKQPVYRDTECITIDEAIIQDCMVTIACYMEQDGDIYLPIFARLKDELERMKANTALKEYARKIARNDVRL